MILCAAANVDPKEAKTGRGDQDDFFGSHAVLCKLLWYFRTSRTLQMIPRQTGFQSGNAATGNRATFQIRSYQPVGHRPISPPARVNNSPICSRGSTRSRSPCSKRLTSLRAVVLMARACSAGRDNKNKSHRLVLPRVLDYDPWLLSTCNTPAFAATHCQCRITRHIPNSLRNSQRKDSC